MPPPFNRTACSLSVSEMTPWSYGRVMSRSRSGWGSAIVHVCLYQCVIECCVRTCVCVLGRSGESPFLCGAEGSFWGWSAGGPADTLSRSSSTTRPYHCSAPHSLCPVQSDKSPPPTLQHLHPLLLSLALQVQLIRGPEEEEVQA